MTQKEPIPTLKTQDLNTGPPTAGQQCYPLRHPQITFIRIYFKCVISTFVSVLEIIAKHSSLSPCAFRRRAIVVNQV